MNTIKNLVIFLCFTFLHINFLSAQIYRFENDSLKQEIKIIKSKKGLNFEYTVENKNFRITSIIQGKAEKIWGVDNLEPGQLPCLNNLSKVMFVDKYIFEIPKYHSGIYIYIEYDNKKEAVIEEYNMNDFRSKYCPFTSQGILRLVK